MTPERWQLIQTILGAVWDAPDEVREAIVVQRCAGDAGLLAEVQSLLSAHESADRWMAPAAAAAAVRPAAERLIGPYRLERLLGRGGMGVVYLAHRVEGEFDQKVAVKIIGLPFELEPFRERFRRERQILAGLNHPNITHLLDGGITPDGDLYLAMEFVEGLSPGDYCERHALDEAARLRRLFLPICDAVAYAHQRLIVHCDLKPSNILISETGVPKLLDFGTAKVLGAENGDRTQTGLGLVTAAYASPEQLRGEPASTLGDVFSLGVVLYEIVSATRLFGNDVVSRLEHTGALVLPAPLTGDLERIVRKSLAPEMTQRYASVEQLAADVQRYLDGRPVLAHPPGLIYRARKFVQRRFWYLAAAALSAAALVAATLVSYAYARQSQLESERAHRIAAFTMQVLLSTTPAWVTSMSGHSGPITMEDVLDNAADRAGKDLAGDAAAEAQIRGTLGQTWAALGNSRKALPQFEIALAKMPTGVAGLENERATLLESACNAASFQGDYQRARVLCGQAIDELDKASKPDPNLAFSAPFDFAYMSAKEGAPPEDVERLYRKSADASARYFGTSDLRYFIAMTRVGASRFDAGDLGESSRILESAVSGMRALPGPPVELAIARRSLAAVYRVQGRFDSAERQADDALTLLDRRPAPFIDRYLIELERSLDRALSGRAADAAVENQSIVEPLFERLPAGHIDRARPDIFAGRTLVLAGRCREAEPLLREADDIYRARLPNWPGMEADALAGLSEALSCQSKETDASQAAAAARLLYQRAFGARASTHPAVLALRR